MFLKNINHLFTENKKYTLDLKKNYHKLLFTKFLNKTSKKEKAMYSSRRQILPPWVI